MDDEFSIVNEIKAANGLLCLLSIHFMSPQLVTCAWPEVLDIRSLNGSKGLSPSRSGSSLSLRPGRQASFITAWGSLLMA